MKPPSILSDFDFSLLDSPEFKEDSVREEIILPIVKALGYSPSGANRIVRSKSLSHPFVTVGSKEKPITNYPDYLLIVEPVNVWVLDAKGPDEEIKAGKNNSLPQRSTRRTPHRESVAR